MAKFFRQTGPVLGLAAGRADLLAGRPGLRKLALRDLVALPKRVPPAQAAHMIRSAAGCELRDELIGLTEREHFGDLGPIDCPVRIAWGTEDRPLPPARCSSRLRARSCRRPSGSISRASATCPCGTTPPQSRARSSR